jgi:hypothetical protein
VRLNDCENCICVTDCHRNRADPAFGGKESHTFIRFVEIVFLGPKENYCCVSPEQAMTGSVNRNTGGVQEDEKEETGSDPYVFSPQARAISSADQLFV